MPFSAVKHPVKFHVILLDYGWKVLPRQVEEGILERDYGETGKSFK